MDLIFVYITNPTKKEAKKVAHHLLKKKLIACANLFPIESLYRWEGKMTHEREYALIAKTTKSNFKHVKDVVEKIHPYSVPCITKLAAEANESFHKWVKHEVLR
jgi:periplasmic divalent cation tolerance protein